MKIRGGDWGSGKQEMRRGMELGFGDGRCRGVKDGSRDVRYKARKFKMKW